MTFAFIFESVGGTEWLVLLGVVLIVVGPKNLPAAARKIGQIMSTLRRAADEFKRQLMAMDQEVTKAVNETTSDDASSSSSGGDTASADQGDPDNGSDLYGEDNPYPGYEEYYDETHYDDGSSPETSETSSEDVAQASAEPPAKAPPTEEELRAIKITVTTDAQKKEQKA